MWLVLANPEIKTGKVCKFHLLEFTSHIVKRVCRSTVQAEAYTLRNGIDRAERLRGVITDLYEPLNLKHWEAQAGAFMKHIWFTDCKSVYDACKASKVGKMEDKRLSIEFAGFRQDLWRRKGNVSGDPHYDDEPPVDGTDEIRWIDTDVMPVDCMTKAMDTTFIRKLLTTNTWDTSQPDSSKAKKQAKAESRRRNKETLAESNDAE